MLLVEEVHPLNKYVYLVFNFVNTLINYRVETVKSRPVFLSVLSSLTLFKHLYHLFCLFYLFLQYNP
jgi:hypothetical protein